jgi:hypothetical protein
MELQLVVQQPSGALAVKQCLQLDPQSLNPQHNVALLSCFHYQIDRRRQTASIRSFFFKLRASGRGQGIKSGFPSRPGFCPFGFDPDFLFEPMQRGVERSLLDLSLAN